VAELETGITSEPIDPAQAIDRVGNRASGGLGIFVGTVRASPAVHEARDKEVIRLEYEAHPTLADERLRAVCAEAKEKWALNEVIALHRTGACDVGEVTVVVACSAPHRAEALDACRHIIDTIKETVPIWKREVYRDGSAWVGANRDHPAAP
jgi:molybdopterin synthase catalytic subunit